MRLIIILTIALSPGSCSEQRAQHYYNKGLWAVDEGNYKQAIVNYRKSIEISPNFDAARLDLGGMLLETGQLEEAEQHFLYIIRRSPGDSDAYAYLGILYMKKRSYLKAEEMYKKFLDIDPSAPVQWDLGLVLLELKKFKEARKALEKDSFLRSGSDKNYHFALAKALAGHGKIMEAEVQEEIASEVERKLFE